VKSYVLGFECCDDRGTKLEGDEESELKHTTTTREGDFHLRARSYFSGVSY
jgi:hypothetical protein